eukprot:gene33831-45310_t
MWLIYAIAVLALNILTAGHGHQRLDPAHRLFGEGGAAVRIDVRATRTRAWRGAEIPAAGGTGNARSIAKVHTILANGGVSGGKRFMSEAGCRKALELQIEGTDLILGTPVRFGMGFGLAGGLVPLPSPNSFFWGGYGGSLVIIDMDARTTFGYAMNRMAGTTTGDMRALGLSVAMWQGLGLIPS